MISSVDICIQYSGQFALQIRGLLEQELGGGPETLDVPPELGHLLLAQRLPALQLGRQAVDLLPLLGAGVGAVNLLLKR